MQHTVHIFLGESPDMDRTVHIFLVEKVHTWAGTLEILTQTQILYPKNPIPRPISQNPIPKPISPNPIPNLYPNNPIPKPISHRHMYLCMRSLGPCGRASDLLSSYFIIPGAYDFYLVGRPVEVSGSYFLSRTTPQGFWIAQKLKFEMLTPAHVFNSRIFLVFGSCSGQSIL